jgi:hypothetical protein
MSRSIQSKTFKTYLEDKLGSNDNQIIKKNVELINKGATETITEQQELCIEVLNIDTVR